MTVYTVAKHFITALINDDYTGLEDGDHIMLEDFLADVDGSYWTLEHEEQHDNFKRCEVTNLMADCTTITLNK